MADREVLLEVARGKRELASRARRVARGLSFSDDHARLIEYAEELEAAARNLERQFADDKRSTGHAAPPVQHEQIQQQQQHEGVSQSYEQIGSHTGIAVGTVKSRISRGRAVLMRLLARQAVGEAR